MFGDRFCFLFSKTCFREYKKKTIFLFFWNKKHVWLVEIKKIVFLKNKNKKPNPYPAALPNIVFGWVEFRKDRKYKKENGVESWGYVW